MDHVDPETGELRDVVQGPEMVGLVLLVFVLPPATAIGGAYLMNSLRPATSSIAESLWQIGGAVGGFFVGVYASKLVLWTCRRLFSAGGGVE